MRPSLIWRTLCCRNKSNPYAPAEHQAEVSKDMLFLHDKTYRLVEVRCTLYVYL
jgi:hypothetical protein